MLEIHQFPCLADNYGFLLHDPQSGETAAIDTPDGGEYLRQAQARGWAITQIWNTHWHPDHTGGNAAIAAATAAPITAPQEVERVSPVDRVIADGDTVTLGRWTVRVIDVGGHTKGHIAYHITEADLAFVGDSLFPLGCGRMFEGTAGQFWDSLCRLRALPPETVFYSAHEYAAGNARFALHADAQNPALRAYADEIERKRAAGEPTVPATLARELDTNPFLRADTEALSKRWGGKTGAETFAILRAAKDSF